MKSDVREPGWPYCVTSRPGTARSTSDTTTDSCFSSSCRVITVIAEPTSFSSSGTEVAVTTTLSDVGGTCCARAAAGTRSQSAAAAAAAPTARERSRRDSASRPKSVAVPSRSAKSVFQKNGIAAAKQSARPAGVFG